MVAATKAEPIAAAVIVSRFAPKWCGSFAPRVIAIKTEPGPTVKGSVSGQNASCRTSVLTVRPTASRSLSLFCLSLAKPVEMTLRPRPTCTTGREIPKNESTCNPIVTDAISSTRLFTAMRRASSVRVCGVQSLVSARKIGLPPIGSRSGRVHSRPGEYSWQLESSGRPRRYFPDARAHCSSKTQL
jgi:hypothetical protein